MKDGRPRPSRTLKQTILSAVTFDDRGSLVLFSEQERNFLTFLIFP